MLPLCFFVGGALAAGRQSDSDSLFGKCKVSSSVPSQRQTHSQQEFSFLNINNLGNQFITSCFLISDVSFCVFTKPHFQYRAGLTQSNRFLSLSRSLSLPPNLSLGQSCLCLLPLCLPLYTESSFARFICFMPCSHFLFPPLSLCSLFALVFPSPGLQEPSITECGTRPWPLSP